jgi:Fucose permease
MWGFITSLNDILIPYFKVVYNLTHFQANIVQLAFFIAYFVGAATFLLLSKTNNDPIHRYGYRKTLEIGLIIAASACVIFSTIASAGLGFPFFLGALFLLGIGLTFLQVAANPFVSVLGSSDTASSRLNLSQAFNSLGTTLGPALGSYLIFGVFLKDATGASAVQVPYLVLGLLLLFLAIFIHNVKITEPSNEQNFEKKDSIFAHPYVILGALGIFFYVGAEVSVGSNMVSYITETTKGRISATLAGGYLSYYWGGAMIGRFLGSVSLSKMKLSSKALYMALLAGAAFVVIYTVNYYLHSIGFKDIIYFFAFMALNYICFFIGRGKPHTTLAIFALINVCLVSLGAFCHLGSLSIWALLAIGLFNSIMWSNVFTLAIAKLEERTAQASSILVMMILGGAILPPLQGAIADCTGNISISFIVPLFSYIYLIFYGAVGYKIGLKE